MIGMFMRKVCAYLQKNSVKKQNVSINSMWVMGQSNNLSSSYISVLLKIFIMEKNRIYSFKLPFYFFPYETNHGLYIN